MLAPIVGKIIVLGKKDAIIRNMKMVLGDGVEDNWQSLYHKHTAQLGLTIIESFQLATMSPESLRRHLTLCGEEHLTTTLREGRGVVLFVNHLGNLGFIGVALALRGFDITVTSNIIPLPYAENKIEELFDRCGAKRIVVGEAMVDAAARILCRNAILASIVDYSVTAKHTAWIRFGRAEMEVSLAPAILALRAKAPILWVDVTPLGRNHHVISILPSPLSKAGTGGTSAAQTIVQDALLHVTDELRKRPAQWWRWDYARLRPPPAS